MTFKEQEKSIAKNLIEKLTFSVIFSVKNQLSVNFKRRQKSKMKIPIEMFKVFVHYYLNVMYHY